MVWNVTNLVFFEDLRAKQIEEDVTPIMLEVAEYEAKIEGYNKLSDAKLKEAKAIVNAAIQIKIQFPNMDELYNDKLSEAAEMDKLVGNYKREISILEKKIKKLLNQVKLIEEAKDVVITDDEDKKVFLNKVVESISVRSVDLYSGVITVTFKTGAIINIFYKSHRTKGLRYLILDNDLYKFIPEELVFEFKTTKFEPMSFNMGIEITTRNTPEEMFDMLQDEIIKPAF